MKTIPLTELLKSITPLPYAVKCGDPKTENEVSNVRGVKIFGGYKAVMCKHDAAYLAHAANHLPKLVEALEKIAKLQDGNARLLEGGCQKIANDILNQTQTVRME